MSTQSNSDQPESPHPMAELVVTDIEIELHKKMLEEFDLMSKEPNAIEEHAKKAQDYGKELVDEVNKRDPEIMIRRKKNANDLPEDQKILLDKSIEELFLMGTNWEPHWTNFQAYVAESRKLRNERKMAEAIEKVENLNVDHNKEHGDTVQQNANQN